MANVLQTKKGVAITTEKIAFASGGEGELFRIISPSNFLNQIVKIYKADKRTKERETKIQYLINNRLTSEIDNLSVIWINEIVLENGVFVGIVLPFASGVSLEYLCHQKRHRNLGSEWQKFDFKSLESIKLRTKICFNIAVALYHIHSTKKYVLMDMKPENVIIQSNGLISIIDVDSIGIIEKNKVLFRPPVTTPEYTPPEYYNKSYDVASSFDESWDRFSMAVIFYRLLCGIHPFTGSCNAPYNNCNGLVDMVENGLFPNGPKKAFFKTIPPPHALFFKLDSTIQQLFLKCFIEGHDNRFARPSADDWCKVLAPPEFALNRRKLPSQQNDFPATKTSNPINFDTVILNSFPVVDFVSWGKFKIIHILKKFLMKSKFELICQEIQRKESELSSILNTEGSYFYELDNIKNKFHSLQTIILEKEKFDIGVCLNNYKTTVVTLDEKVKKNIENEYLEKRKLQDIFLKKISEIKIERQKIYTTVVEIPINDLKNQKKILDIEYLNVDSLRNRELSSLLNNVDKLSMYSIDKYFESIFGFSNDDMKFNLRKMGFVTAADILDVNSNGEIKNRNRRYVKVPTIAAVRGQLLKSWRARLEKEEDKKIHLKIASKYDRQISDLKLKISNKERELNSYQSKADNTYGSLVGKMDKDLVTAESEKELSFSKITSTFEEFNSEYSREASINHENTVLKLIQINNETNQKLTGNFSEKNALVQILQNKKSAEAVRLTTLIEEYEVLRKNL